MRNCKLTSQNDLCDSSLKWLVSPGFFAHGHYRLTYTANPPNPGVITTRLTADAQSKPAQWKSDTKRLRKKEAQKGWSRSMCQRVFKCNHCKLYPLLGCCVFLMNTQTLQPPTNKQTKRTHNTSYQRVKEISCCTPRSCLLNTLAAGL